MPKLEYDNPRQLILATVEQIMRAPAHFERIHSSSINPEQGFYAVINDNIRGYKLMVPGATEFEAACNLMAMIRETHPIPCATAELDIDGVRGLYLYSEHVTELMQAELVRTFPFLAGSVAP